MRFLYLIIFLVVTPSALPAAWLTWTTVTTGSDLTASFPGAGVGYGGVVTAKTSNVNDGLANGVIGIAPGSNGNLTPTFLSNYFTNTGGILPYLNAGYNDTGDAYRVTVDFSGLVNSYLPSGTIIALLDVDIQEKLSNLSARDASNAIIGSTWLQAFSGQRGLLDYDNSDFDSSSTIPGPSSSYLAGVYNFTSTSSNYTSSLLGFTTTQNIRSFSFDLSKSNNDPILSGSGGYAIAIGTGIPEPSTYLLSGIGLLMVLFKRQKRDIQ